MKSIIGAVILFFTLLSCVRKDSVQISGRIESGDSLVSIWVHDSVYTFPLDESGFFSGEITLLNSTYASLLPYSINIYLTPGENLEVYLNAFNISGSLDYRGNLGGINTYLKEQEVAVFFDKDNYYLEEDAFIRKMKELIDEKTKLLEAKNFDQKFTGLEKQRIRYSIGERVTLYPFYHKEMTKKREYRPGKAFSDFLASFSINNNELYDTKDYRNFLLNYVYLQGGRDDGGIGNYSDDVVDYILSKITDPDIKNFLLTEIVYRYIWENNGLNGAGHLLSVFRRECTDVNKKTYIEDMVAHWEKIMPGQMAPDFTIEDVEGKEVRLSDFKGNYLYITVWATWCIPCKKELPFMVSLAEEYKDKNMHFLTISVDALERKDYWKEFLEKSHYPGIHTIAGENSMFSEKYMIVSVPRFILISPEGKIIDSNAPRLSGPIRPFLQKQNFEKIEET